MVQNLERSRTPGRNDPCPCGSGKKYKRCCLLSSAPLHPVRRREDVLRELAVVDEAGDRAEAIRILEEARLELQDPDLDTLLAARYAELTPEEAEAALRAWWEQEHDRFSGTGLARVVLDAGRREDALAILSESQGTEAPPQYWRLLASLRDEQGETIAATTAMELYTRLAPEDAEAWMTLADLQFRIGQNDRALQALRRAGDLLPDHIAPRLSRLRILAGERRWRETRDLAEALLEGRYTDTTPEMQRELRDLLARAYFVSGDFDAARRLWENLLVEHPDDAEVRHQLAGLELTTGRHRRVLNLLDPQCDDPRTLETCLRSMLALHEFDGALEIARSIDGITPGTRVETLVQAARAIAEHEHEWAGELLEGEPPETYRDLWLNLRIDCLAHLGRWQDVWPLLKSIVQPDDDVFVRVALAAMSAGKVDLAERIVARIEDQQTIEVRSLSALLGPVRQARRAAEVRRQQQVDQAERQRWTLEARDLRRRIRELEQHNAALVDALSLSETSLERLLEQVGVLAEDSGTNWEVHVKNMAERAHRDALALELKQAEQRLSSMLGPGCWSRLSEAARASLREGEWLFAAVEGEGRDYGASLLEYARGLERAFKDAIFIPARARWQRLPGPTERLQDEGHDPSLGPLVRYILQGSHLTLGSMASALERMSDARRQGVAVTLLRQEIGIDGYDERTLNDWKRIAERLGDAADARNRPAHAAAVSRDEVRAFRELLLGAGGLLHALDRP